MATSNVKHWQDEIHALNEARSLLVYKLMDKAGHDPHDWQAIAQVQASDHPKLVAINNRIHELVANLRADLDATSRQQLLERVQGMSDTDFRCFVEEDMPFDRDEVDEDAYGNSIGPVFESDADYEAELRAHAYTYGRALQS